MSLRNSVPPAWYLPGLPRFRLIPRVAGIDVEQGQVPGKADLRGIGIVVDELTVYPVGECDPP